MRLPNASLSNSPATASVRVEPSWNDASTGLPTCRPSRAALSAATRMLFSSRLAQPPAVNGRSSSAAAWVGSRVRTRFTEGLPFSVTLSRLMPIPSAASTSGTATSSSASVPGRPPNPLPSASLVETAKSPVNCSPMVSRMDDLIDEPRVDTPTSRARPMPRAPAVSAVRFGLVAALRAAISPVTPRTERSAGVSSRATGAATSGPSTTSDTNSPTTPAANHTGSVVRPSPTPTAAMTAKTTPVTRRPRETADLSTDTSRSAASGGTRPDRMAGTTAHTSVTATPTTRVMTNDDGLTVSSVPLGPKPMELSSFMMPVASSTPAPKPTTPPNTPTTSASVNSTRVTWPRLAPMARSSAFSRWRWAALMLNTL